MPPKKRDNKSCTSGKGQGSRAHRKPSSSSNREGPPPHQPTGNPTGQNPSAVFGLPTANNEFVIPKAAQAAPGLQAGPYMNNFAYGYAPAPQRPQHNLSDSEFIRLFRTPIPPPAIPGRVGQIYGDARDYLTSEQQEALMRVSGPQGSPAMQAGRSTVNHPSQHALELNGGLPAGYFSDGRFNGERLGPNPSNSGTAYGIAQPRPMPGPSATRSGRNAGLLPSTARLSHLINEVPDTPSPRGRANRDRARSSQPSKTQKARKFSDRDSNPPTPSFKRGRRIEDITDQEEGGDQSQALVAYNRNPSNDAAPRSVQNNLIYGDSSPSFQPDTTNSTARNSASLLSDPFMGSADTGGTGEASVMGPPPLGVILPDNYNIFNHSLMARVAAECEKTPYRNTPRAIATYHQLAMADDLFYSGIWRGMFQANEGHIFEYHNPAPRRPEVDESLRSDRRTLMSQAQKKDGKIVWCPVIKGNALLLPEAEEMEGPPVEYQNTLDLMKYFWARCPGARSIDRYAELVAPLYVDPSREANDENRALVGMVPGSDPTTAALRLATPAEASSAAARAALRYAPALRYSAPAAVATETRIAPVAPVDIGMAPNASAALLPPVGTNIAPNVTAYSPGSLGLFPGPDVASNASAVQPPPVDSSWLDPTGLGPSLDLGIDLNAQSMSGVPFHPVNTDTTQDNIVFDWTNLSQYGDQDLVPVHPPTSVEMPSFENTRSAFNITGSSYPGYQSTFQGPAAIPTSGNTIPSLHAPVNALDDTATVPTPVAQFPITNAGTTSGFAGPYSHYVAPNSNPGMALNVTTMPTASFAPASFAPTSFAPVGDGRNLDVMNSTIGNYSVPWGSSMHTWLTSGRRSPGSVRMGLNHEDSSNTIDPANYGVAHIPNQSGGNTFASNEQPTGNGQLINGVVFSNGAIADEYSDECTENHSDSTLPSDDLDDTTDEGTEEGADVEMVNGVRFR